MPSPPASPTPQGLQRGLKHWLQRGLQRLRSLPVITAPLWLQTLADYPFLTRLSLLEQAQLRHLCAHFLRHKQFTGVHGLVVTDAMALAIAAQACLPLLHWGEPRRALRWYDDFVGIVIHPADALARRQEVDDAGVMHYYSETLQGEAMDGGPVMLSWPAVTQAGQTPAEHSTSNVVIHEFAHKIDMRNGSADGCPPLPPGFMGSPSPREAHTLWQAHWGSAYTEFRELVLIAERFGGPRPWLDAYAATAPEEFFAVTCEAFFVQPQRFAQEFPTLRPLLEAFFKPNQLF